MIKIYLQWLTEHLGIYEVLSNNFFLDLLDSSLCKQTAITQPICDNILFLIAGYDSQQLNTVSSYKFTN